MPIGVTPGFQILESFSKGFSIRFSTGLHPTGLVKTPERALFSEKPQGFFPSLYGREAGQDLGGSCSMCGIGGQNPDEFTPVFFYSCEIHLKKTQDSLQIPLSGLRASRPYHGHVGLKGWEDHLDKSHHHANIVSGLREILESRERIRKWTRAYECFTLESVSQRQAIEQPRCMV
jgi:hypothetical protein